MNKHICEMTLQEFLEVPYRQANDKVIYCYHFVIIPTDEFNSKPSPLNYRYKNMIIIAVDKYCNPICRVSDKSDIMFLYGCLNHGWRIDCLPESGLICIDTDEVIKIKIKGNNKLNIYSGDYDDE